MHFIEVLYEILHALLCYLNCLLKFTHPFSFAVQKNVNDSLKQSILEAALKNPNIPVDQWKKYAKSPGGLINGNLFDNFTCYNFKPIEVYSWLQFYMFFNS